MKFKAGDNFKVIDSGLLGQVVGISFNSMYQCEEYVVKWSNLPYEQTYPVDECDSIWELEPCPVVDIYLKTQKSISFIPVDIKISDSIKIECSGHHTPVDVGFHHSKFVCRYCNKDLPNAH